jgi:serine/threonine protein kinase
MGAQAASAADGPAREAEATNPRTACPPQAFLASQAATQPRDESMAGPPPVARRQPVEGALLASRWRLDERIGQGGMGIVFRATDTEMQSRYRTVAVKVLKAELQEHEAALKDEVGKAKLLQDETVIRVDHFVPRRDSGGYGAFMVMEYLSGGAPLDQYVMQKCADGMTFREASLYIQGMGRALSYAHRKGIIHSDFKPSNVFVMGPSVKVLDFGIARAVRSSLDDSAPGEAPVGLTPAFASCEMLESQPADRRDDVFCFGLVVYFLLTGRHPFDGKDALFARDTKLTIPPVRGLSRRQNAALSEALRFQRRDRTPTIQQVVDGLHTAGRAPNRAALWVGLSAGVIAAGSVGYVLYGREFASQDSDQEYLAEICKNTRQGQVSTDAQVASALLDQGNEYLQDGISPFDPGTLSENVSSALGAFQAVSQLGTDYCDAGARGMLKVATAYKAEAQRLFRAGDYAKAREINAIGLRIWPDSMDMRRLQAKIATRAPVGPDR